MAKKQKLAPAPVPEEPKLVSMIDDFAFLLSDNPEAIKTLEPQALLHAILPRTVNKTKIMPPGSSFADTWMLKYGNPMSSVDAALRLVKEVEPKFSVSMRLLPNEAHAQLIAGQIVKSDLTNAETLPGAIIICLLQYLSAKEKQ